MVRVVCCLHVAALLAVPALARAGTLCGTVTDRTTSAAVADAGVFLRTPAGVYTGLNGATDAGGQFCIAAVPAGTYDIEVRVDDYQVAYLRGVVVTDSPSSVELPAHAALDRRTVERTDHLQTERRVPSGARRFVFDARPPTWRCIAGTR